MELLKLVLRLRAEELSVWVELAGGVWAEVEVGKGSLVDWALREGLCKCVGDWRSDIGSLAAVMMGTSPRITATGLLSPLSSSSESKQITSTFSLLGVLITGAAVILPPLFIIPLVEGVASGTGGMGNGLLTGWVALT